ncbi:TetR/AcrR family transcriptional regulator [Lactococcus lactis subsp. lactis]|uniref:TetR/AcrR family transcriptional regulator n=1 Tax=Lactococcus lactis TaxID=1358 RepID=UPI00223C3C05|nr:TetR/AcrR family transcriptional regulator [Lactococcus lactis]MCT0017568.1 TetR/AcrR family transcriptional regulator [Lactococcus lactis subsp. lactis]
MKENSQSRSSKEWIIDSLIYLLKTKPYSAITITEIAKKAGVARLTFYRHFENKEEIIITRSQYLFQKYFDELNNKDKKLDLNESLLLCFKYWKQDSEAIKLLEKNNLIYLLENTFYLFLEKLIEETRILNKLNPIQKYFIIGGLTHSMVFWITTSTPLSPEEVSETIINLFNLKVASHTEDNTIDL